MRSEEGRIQEKSKARSFQGGGWSLRNELTSSGKPRSVAFTCAKEQLTETAEWVRDGRRSYRERRASHLVQAVDLEVLRCKGRRVRDSRLKNARKRTSRAEK